MITDTIILFAAILAAVILKEVFYPTVSPSPARPAGGDSRGLPTGRVPTMHNPPPPPEKEMADYECPCPRCGRVMFKYDVERFGLCGKCSSMIYTEP